MIRCIFLSIKTGSGRSKAQEQFEFRTRSKMSSHFILGVWLLFAGVGVLHASCSSFTGAGSSSGSSPGGPNGGPTYEEARILHCNKCLSTTFRFVRKIEDALQKGINYFTLADPCSDFSAYEYSICKDILIVLKKSKGLSISDTKKYCFTAGYCPLSPRDKPISPPDDYFDGSDDYNFDSDDDDDDDADDDDYDYSYDGNSESADDAPSGYFIPNGFIGSGKPAQNSTPVVVPSESPCDLCKGLATDMKNNMTSVFEWIDYCAKKAPEDSKNCFNLLEKSGEKIYVNLTQGQNPTEICQNLNLCSAMKPYPYCLTCNAYVVTLETHRKKPERRACSTFRGLKKRKCIRTLRKKRRQIKRLLKKEKNPGKVCRAVKLCAGSLGPFIF